MSALGIYTVAILIGASVHIDSQYSYDKYVYRSSPHTCL